MSFIQCKDKKELEEVLEKRDIKFAFVTEDNRIYFDMNFCDDALHYHLPGATVLALLDLQLNLEMIADYDRELEDIQSGAQCALDSLKKALEIIKHKPLKREEKGNG